MQPINHSHVLDNCELFDTQIITYQNTAGGGAGPTSSFTYTVPTSPNYQTNPPDFIVVKSALVKSAGAATTYVDILNISFDYALFNRPIISSPLYASVAALQPILPEAIYKVNPSPPSLTTWTFTFSDPYSTANGVFSGVITIQLEFYKKKNKNTHIY